MIQKVFGGFCCNKQKKAGGPLSRAKLSKGGTFRTNWVLKGHKRETNVEIEKLEHL